jgi:hypothetical protein
MNTTTKTKNIREKMNKNDPEKKRDGKEREKKKER